MSLLIFPDYLHPTRRPCQRIISQFLMTIKTLDALVMILFTHQIHNIYNLVNAFRVVCLIKVHCTKFAKMESFEYSIGHFNNSNFNMFQPDFIPETDFENLLSAVRCETMDPVEKFCQEYDFHHFTNACTAMQLSPHLYGHNEAGDGIGINNDNSSGASDGIGCYDVFDPKLNLTRDQNEVDVKVLGDDDSSETVTTDNPDTQRRSGGGVKGDRTRTLISERKRRIGMKEKLYALRALVPNITKVNFFLSLYLNKTIAKNHHGRS